MSRAAEPARIPCARPACETLFVPRVWWQRYCSNACNQADQYAARAGQPNARGRVELPFDHPAKVRADIRTVLDDPRFWLTEAYTVAMHAERLLDQVERYRRTRSAGARARRAPIPVATGAAAA